MNVNRKNNKAELNWRKFHFRETKNSVLTEILRNTGDVLVNLIAKLSDCK